MSVLLILGGSGSGKSEYAQQRIVSSGIRPRYYVATMEPAGEEARQRIGRHLRLRNGMDFCTIERPVGIGSLAGLAPGALLVEDLTNLLCNEIWSANGRGFSPDLPEQIYDELLQLINVHPLVVLVGNDVYREPLPADPEIARFLEQLGALHRLLARRADEVVEVVAGIALAQAGPDTARHTIPRLEA